MTGLRRVPFRPDRIEAALEFCARHPAAPLGRSVVRHLMTQLVRGPAGVFDVHAVDGRTLIAAAIDVPRNGADSARLEFLGARGDVRADALVTPLFEPALAHLAAGPRRLVDVPAPAWLTGGPRTLERLGFARAYTTFRMALAEDGVAQVVEPALPDGWRWTALTPELTAGAHAALQRIFAGDASLFLAPLDLFAARAADEPDRWRALLIEGELAGLSSVALDGDDGEVVVIGRDPRWRGQGLGRHLLAGAVARLRARGARRVALDVAAQNDRAVALYTGLGFRATSSLDVYRR